MLSCSAARAKFSSSATAQNAASKVLSSLIMSEMVLIELIISIGLEIMLQLSIQFVALHIRWKKIHEYIAYASGRRADRPIGGLGHDAIPDHSLAYGSNTPICARP